MTASMAGVITNSISHPYFNTVKVQVLYLRHYSRLPFIVDNGKYEDKHNGCA